MSFGITPSAYLVIVEQEFNEFSEQQNKTSIRHAMRCAMFSYHIHENIWAYYESDKSRLFNKRTKYEYRQELISRCPNLEIIKDICNYSKHTELTYVSNVDKTEKKNVADKKEFISAIIGVPTGKNPGIFDEVESLVVFREEALIIKTSDGREIRFDEVIESVVKFWRNTFVAEGY